MTIFRAPASGGPPDAFCRGLLRVFLVAALAIAFLHRLAAAQTPGTTVPVGTAPAPAPVAASPDPIPLEIGNTWIYEGAVWWIPYGLRRIYREQVTWTMEITDIHRRGPWTGALLHGHPYDLVRYERGRERGTYLLLSHSRKNGAPRVFLLRGQRAWSAWRRLKDPKDTLKGLAQPAELVLDLPLHRGKRFCAQATPPGSGTRTDAPARRPDPKASAAVPRAASAPVCWSVKEEAPADLRAVRGAEDLAGP
ncbi:MAG TPA: hypothetical protein VFP98_01755, partial [Candidatus Polarisedimenticolia bacterium]|nr:hypothetical protein [Candidatus Polarisedimenticolia bacterium]